MHNMKRVLKKVLKYTFISLVALVVLIVGAVTYLYQTTDLLNPNIAVNLNDYPVSNNGNFLVCKDNYLKKSNSGLYEVYIHGAPLERGVVLGRLSKELLYFQEKTFIDQINLIVPSPNYLKILRILTVIFNRHLGEYVPQEYRKEIYGLSLSCSHDFDAIGPAYERQLNFHAAHDIGHAMQEYMLVGCSSFGAWGNKTSDSTMILGRNFDFFVGDDFAKNKLISFVAPEKGYKYASIGWAGMIGVVSGMNETGLTVTLNAAKGAIPTSAATPISILAREILQYASTIDEAYKIAQNHQTFVCESILIGSAKDGKAAIIEKTPTQIALYNSKTNQIICTNHYQSELYQSDEKNIDNIRTSDSPYRYKRLESLLESNYPLTPNKVATILRNRFGENEADIGLTNEKSLNQSIAHHSVIFQPMQRRMWVSTSPWQSGQYVCYDLNKIFSQKNFSGEIYESELTIEADSDFIKNDYPKILRYRELVKETRLAIHTKKPLSATTLTEIQTTNPNFYHTYSVLGDYYNHFNEPQKAIDYWKMALKKEIPKENERKSIENLIKKTSR